MVVWVDLPTVVQVKPVVVVVAGPGSVLALMEGVGPECPVVPANGADTLGPANCGYSKKDKVYHNHFHQHHQTYATYICYHGIREAF